MLLTGEVDLDTVESFREEIPILDDRRTDLF